MAVTMNKMGPEREIVLFFVTTLNLIDTRTVKLRVFSLLSASKFKELFEYTINFDDNIQTRLES